MSLSIVDNLSPLPKQGYITIYNVTYPDGKTPSYSLTMSTSITSTITFSRNISGNSVDTNQKYLVYMDPTPNNIQTTLVVSDGSNSTGSSGDTYEISNPNSSNGGPLINYNGTWTILR